MSECVCDCLCEKPRHQRVSETPSCSRGVAAMGWWWKSQHDSRNNIDFFFKILFWLDFFGIRFMCRNKASLWSGVAPQARGCFCCTSVWCCCWIHIQQLWEPRDDWQLLLPEDTTLGVCQASNGSPAFPAASPFRTGKPSCCWASLRGCAAGTLLSRPILWLMQAEFSVPVGVDGIWLLTL